MNIGTPSDPATLAIKADCPDCEGKGFTVVRDPRFAGSYGANCFPCSGTGKRLVMVRRAAPFRWIEEGPAH
jgi:DnaJ-class molecular chaperone